jgi:ankyrin repeat protein
MDASPEFRKLFLQRSPLEKFRLLLERCKNYNLIVQEEEVPDSLIHLAVVNKRLDVVKLLVQNGASLEPLEIHPKSEDPYPEFKIFDFDDEDKFTGDPLISAAIQGEQEIFNFLSPIASAGQRNQATLHLADGIRRNSISTSENSTTFQQLADTSPNTDDADIFGRWLADLLESTVIQPDQTDAIRSASTCFLDKCTEQISQGLDVNHIGDNGCTFLWTAAHNGHIEAARALIELGASVDIPNQKDDWTPLMIAVDAHIPWIFGTRAVWGKAESHQVEIVNLLLQAGANVNRRGINGETALILAREYDRDNGYDEEILNMAIREMESALETAVA